MADLLLSQKNELNSLAPFIPGIVAPHSDATGLVTDAANRGFWRKSAESSVEPDRGRPEIKWTFVVKGALQRIENNGIRFAYSLSLPTGLTSNFGKGGENIFDHPPLTGLNLRLNHHAGREADDVPVNLYIVVLQAQADDVVQVLRLQRGGVLLARRGRLRFAHRVTRKVARMPRAAWSARSQTRRYVPGVSRS